MYCLFFLWNRPKKDLVLEAMGEYLLTFHITSFICSIKEKKKNDKIFIFCFSSCVAFLQHREIDNAMGQHIQKSYFCCMQYVWSNIDNYVFCFFFFGFYGSVESLIYPLMKAKTNKEYWTAATDLLLGRKVYAMAVEFCPCITAHICVEKSGTKKKKKKLRIYVVQLLIRPTFIQE